MHPEAIPAAILFLLAFADGILNTLKLRREYQAIAKWVQPGRRRIGRAFVVTAAIVCPAVGWLGFLAVRRLLGFEALEWSFIVSYLVSLPILFLPRYLLRQWRLTGQ